MLNGEMNWLDDASQSDLNMLETVIAACLDAKGKDVALLDMRGNCDFSDYFVLVSGRSDRQVQGICNKLISQLRLKNMKPVTVEGFERGHWVLVDLGGIVVHIFYEPVREQYDLEGLWNKAQRVLVTEQKGQPVLHAA